MKRLLLLNFIIAALSTSVQAAPVQINIAASEVLDTFGSFTTPAGSALNLNALTGIVTSDASTSVVSQDINATIDLGFGSNTVVTGAGADLVIFTVGNGYSFGLQAFDISNNIISNFLYNVPADGSTTAQDQDGNDLCVTENNGCTPISATAINLWGEKADGSYFEIIDGTELSFVRLFIGSSTNITTAETIGDAQLPRLSLVGAVHSAVVPLPLPAVLFGSGLALLGWVGRRKTS